jgi:putative N6-adenine-specific DNA methylase
MDPQMTALARHNTINAIPKDALKGISFQSARAGELQLGEAPGLILTNPPWGRRIETDKDLLFKELRGLRQRFPAWKMAVFCDDEAFETGFGCRADKKTALSNGAVPCWFYQFNAID